MRINQIVSNLTDLPTRLHSDLQTVTANQHHNENHGAAQHSDRSKSFFTPCELAGAGATISNLGFFAALQLANAAFQSGWFTFRVPDDFVSFDSLSVVAAASNPTGDCRLSFQVEQCEIGDLISNDPATEIRNVAYVTDPDFLQDDTFTFAGSPPTFAAGSLVGITLSRDGAHAGDTSTAVLRVLGIRFQYTADQ